MVTSFDMPDLLRKYGFLHSPRRQPEQGELKVCESR
ncbi:hypothetical protein RB2654_15260 [Rhodobacterales bacterium HTCC2654]|uniref:Uncharacterized protein n=1 Tax=Maritimibacter alkaliphilus HTCC2654 TaxID=314271 RepID=A3VHA1_9RHOB|nr:hypothetical protein RB2654_15260 [Rhodobacterales bacterium HTCC2654] [Maritimibacter alkaliphilus HTCC2654]